MSSIHRREAGAAAIALVGLALGSGQSLAATPTPLYSMTLAVGGTDADVDEVMFDGHNIWVGVEELNGGYVRKLGPTGTILTSTAVGIAPLRMAYDGARVWVTNYTSSAVTVVAADGGVVTTIQLPTGADPEGILFDGRYIWVANNGSGSAVANTVSKFDPATLTLVANYPVGQNPDGVAFDGTYIWVTNSNSKNVMKLNRETGAVLQSVATGTFPLSIIFDGHNLWVGDGDNANFKNLVVTGAVTKLGTPGGANRGTFPVGSSVRGLTFDGTLVWICNSLDGTFTRLRASDGARMGTYSSSGSAPRDIAFDGTRMWIANSQSNTVTVVASTPEVLPHTPPSIPAPRLFQGHGFQRPKAAGLAQQLLPLQTTVDSEFSNYVVGATSLAGAFSILLSE